MEDDGPTHAFVKFHKKGKKYGKKLVAIESIKEFLDDPPLQISDYDYTKLYTCYFSESEDIPPAPYTVTIGKLTNKDNDDKRGKWANLDDSLIIEHEKNLVNPSKEKSDSETGLEKSSDKEIDSDESYEGISSSSQSNKRRRVTQKTVDKTKKDKKNKQKEIETIQKVSSLNSQEMAIQITETSTPKENVSAELADMKSKYYTLQENNYTLNKKLKDSENENNELKKKIKFLESELKSKNSPITITGALVNRVEKIIIAAAELKEDLLQGTETYPEERRKRRPSQKDDSAASFEAGEEISEVPEMTESIEDKLLEGTESGTETDPTSEESDSEIQENYSYPMAEKETEGHKFKDILKVNGVDHYYLKHGYSYPVSDWTNKIMKKGLKNHNQRSAMRIILLHIYGKNKDDLARRCVDPRKRGLTPGGKNMRVLMTPEKLDVALLVAENWLYENVLSKKTDEVSVSARTKMFNKCIGQIGNICASAAYSKKNGAREKTKSTKKIELFLKTVKM